MNTQRFGLPVIIAAGLHGALFLISSEPSVIAFPEDKKVIVIPLKPVPEEERIKMPPESESSSTDPAGGPVTPLPELPERIEPLREDVPFTVPITHHPPTLKPDQNLPKITGLPGDLGTGTGPVGRPGIPGVDKLDRHPRAMAQPSPAYPDRLRQDGVDGSVTVEFVVDTEGRVMRAEAVKWTHREFVDPAVRAVLRWRFEPGRQNGRKVRFRMAVPIEFNAAL